MFFRKSFFLLAAALCLWFPSPAGAGAVETIDDLPYYYGDKNLIWWNTGVDHGAYAVMTTAQVTQETRRDLEFIFRSNHIIWYDKRGRHFDPPLEYSCMTKIQEEKKTGKFYISSANDGEFFDMPPKILKQVMQKIRERAVYGGRMYCLFKGLERQEKLVSDVSMNQAEFRFAEKNSEIRFLFSDPGGAPKMKIWKDDRLISENAAASFRGKYVSVRQIHDEILDKYFYHLTFAPKAGALSAETCIMGYDNSSRTWRTYVDPKNFRNLTGGLPEFTVDNGGSFFLKYKALDSKDVQSYFLHWDKSKREFASEDLGVKPDLSKK